MSVKILHAHNYGHKNIGDDAMAQNVFRKLQDIDSDVKTISTYSPPFGQIPGNDCKSLSNFVNRYENIFTKMFLVAIHRLKLTPIYVLYSWFICNTVVCIAKMENAGFITLKGRSDLAKLLFSIKHADVYVRSGSGSLNDIWFWSSMYPQFSEARICRIYGTKVFFIGQGIGPLTGSYREKILCEFTRLCERITLRDTTGSKELIGKVGGRITACEAVGDDAIDLPRATLPLNVTKLMETKSIKVVCQFRPTNYVQNLSGTIWSEIASALREVKSLYGNVEIILVSFSNGRVSDLAAAKEINEKSGGQFLVVEEILTASQAKLLLSKADLAIGQSYHFGVFALSENTSFIGNFTNDYYEKKMKGLLAWYGMERYALGREDIGALVEMARELIERRTEQMEKLGDVNIRIREHVNNVFVEIAQVLHCGH